MNNRTKRHPPPTHTQPHRSRSEHKNNGNGGEAGNYSASPITAAVSCASSGPVNIASSASFAPTFSPSPIASPRHIVPQPRSSRSEASLKEAVPTGANQFGSTHPSNSLEELSTLRSGYANHTHQGPAPLAATTGPAARNNTSHVDDNGSKGSGAISSYHSVPNPRFSKRASSNVDIFDTSFLNNNNGVRRRAGAPGGGSNSSSNGGVNNGACHNMSAPTMLQSSSGTNTGGGSNSNNNDNGGCAAALAVARLQPPTNHSRVNLFVRDLPLDLKENQLRAMFAPYGEIINSAIMRNIHTGVSLGTAFVRFAQHAEAMRAMEAFAGGRAMTGSKRVTVQWARREHDKAPAGDERKRMRKIFIRNVPKDVTQEMLISLFSQFGPVKTVSTHRDTAAANAVSQPSAAVVVSESSEATPDASVNGGGLPMSNTPNNSNASNEDRRIAFVTFDVEGVAEQATTAIHNTMPFPSCHGIPLMVKLAEDTPIRHANNSNNTNTNSSNNNNNMNGNANFSALGAIGSAASAATMPAGSHVFINQQPSNPALNWGDFQSSEYLRSPTISPPMMHLATNTGTTASVAAAAGLVTVPPTTGANRNATTSMWRVNMTNGAPQGRFYFGSPEGLRPQNSSNNNPTATSSSGAAPALSALRAVGGAAMGSAPSPPTAPPAAPPPPNSNTTTTATTPYVVQSGSGVSTLRQPQQPQASAQPAAALAPQQGKRLAAGSPFSPFSLEEPGQPSSPQQQQQSTNIVGTNNSAAVGAQTSLQDLCCLGYMASGNDMYTFQATTGPPPDILGLAGGSMAMPSYDPQDSSALATSYSSRGMHALRSASQQQQQPPYPVHPVSHAPGTNADCSPRNTSFASISSNPTLPSPVTFSFLQSSPRSGHNSSSGTAPQQFSTVSEPSPSMATTIAAASSSPSVLGPQSHYQQQIELHDGCNNNIRNTNNQTSRPFRSVAVVPPAPRSVAAAAAAAAAGVNRNNTTVKNSDHNRSGERTATITEKNADKSGGSNNALAAVHSDLATSIPSPSGCHSTALSPSAARTPAGADPTASLTTSNPQIASLLSSASVPHYQPYEVIGSFSTSIHGRRALSIDVGNSAGGSRDTVRGIFTNTDLAAASATTMNDIPVAPKSGGGLGTAPPTHPTIFSLPSSGSGASLARPFLTQNTSTPVRTAHLMPTTSALIAAGNADAVLPLDNIFDPFDYDDYKDTDGNVLLKSQCTSSYAAEVLRAVTEDTEDTEESLGISPTHHTSQTTNTTIATAATVTGRVACTPLREHSGGRRRSFTSPSGMFAQDSSDAPCKAGIRLGSGRKSFSLPLGGPVLFDDKFLYQWDSTAAALPGPSSTSPVGAIGSQAASPVAGAKYSTSHNVFNFMAPSTCITTQELKTPVANAAMSAPNMWLTTDGNSYWSSAQMNDPQRLMPQAANVRDSNLSTVTTATSTAMTSDGTKGNSTQVSHASMKSLDDLSRHSTARTLPGTTAPPIIQSDDDDEQTGWGAYPDLTLHLS